MTCNAPCCRGWTESADIEAQVVDHNRAERDERLDAERYDKTEYRRIAGELVDEADVPDLADVADLDERGRR